MQKSSTELRVRRREYEVWLTVEPGSAISGVCDRKKKQDEIGESQ